MRENIVQCKVNLPNSIELDNNLTPDCVPYHQTPNFQPVAQHTHTSQQSKGNLALQYRSSAQGSGPSVCVPTPRADEGFSLAGYSRHCNTPVTNLLAQGQSSKEVFPVSQISLDVSGLKQKV